MRIQIIIPDEIYKKFDRYYDVEGSIKDYIETIVKQIEQMEKDWKEIQTKQKNTIDIIEENP